VLLLILPPLRLGSPTQYADSNRSVFGLVPNRVSSDALLVATEPKGKSPAADRNLGPERL